jgi:hypothetical protein
VLAGALALVAVGALALARPGVAQSFLGAPWTGAAEAGPWGGAVTPAASTGDASVATLGTQPSVELQSWDPAHIGTLRFNPCMTDNYQYEAMEWSKGNVKPYCKVDALQCAFCTWVLQFDSEYRVNDIVTCLGPTYKMAAEAVVNEAKFSGTILQRMLAAKGKKPDGTINWPADKFQEAKDNFVWMIEAIRNEWCDVPDHRTLIVHIRAGDNLNDDFKNIPHIPAAIQQMKDYLTHRPYITRIELSSVLHFGVPAPDSQFQYNDGVGDAYLMSDEALRKNGLILGHFYEAALSTGRDVWFTSTNDPDQDMCRYAKACHFLTASLSKQEMMYEGPMEQRLSFSELVRDLHKHLSSCDAHDTAEWTNAAAYATAETGKAEIEPAQETQEVAQEWAEDPHPTGEVRGAPTEEKAAPAEKVAPAESASSILSRLLGHNAAIPWRSRR